MAPHPRSSGRAGGHACANATHRNFAVAKDWPRSEFTWLRSQEALALGFRPWPPRTPTPDAREAGRAGPHGAGCGEAAVRIDSHPSVLQAVEPAAAPDARRRPLRRPALDRRQPEPVGLMARGVSALEPDRPSALHEAGLGALQIWQSLAESAGRGRGEREVTIVFTDLVGFSSWALTGRRRDRARAPARRRRRRRGRLLRPRRRDRQAPRATA